MAKRAYIYRDLLCDGIYAPFMADNEQKAADKEAKLAAKAALKAKKERIKKNKPKKNMSPKAIFSRIIKAIAKFFKDFRGTAKKIVWPDLKTVLRNTGIVLVVVGFLGLSVFAIDWVVGNSSSLIGDAVANINNEDETTTASSDDDADEATTAASTTAAQTTAAETTAEETTAQ